MTTIAHTAAPVTFYEADDNGWDIQIVTSPKGTTSHMGRSRDGSLLRFYCSLTITPAAKRLTVVMFDDCPIARIGKVIRLAHNLARRDGEWERADWGRGQWRNGNEWLSIRLGDRVDVDAAFAQLTENVDLSSEVTA